MLKDLSLLLVAAVAAALAGCGDEEEGRVSASGTVDHGDTLQSQGVEIVDGRFVPDLVTIYAGQIVNFINRDDSRHRIVKLSGPGREFRSQVLDPGERYRVGPVAKPGWKLRTGTVVYVSEGEGRPKGRITVYGTAIPRRDRDRVTFEREPPTRPDGAAQRRARDLAAYVSQCVRDFRRCDSPQELVTNVGGAGSRCGSFRVRRGASWSQR